MTKLPRSPMEKSCHRDVNGSRLICAAFRPLVILCAFVSGYAAAAVPAETPLTIDAPPITRTLNGDVQPYSLSLAAGQFVAVLAQQQGADITIEIDTPDGKTLRTVDTPNGAYGPEETAFDAPIAGLYQIVIRPTYPHIAAVGRYRLAVEGARRYAATKAHIHSPRLRRLWEDVQNDPADHAATAVAAFLKERAAAKSPLIEAIPGDTRNVLLTFLYPGDASTRTVIVTPAPTVKNALRMTRFADTYLWTASAVVPKDTRAEYQFTVSRATLLSQDGAPNPPLLLTDEETPDPLNPQHNSLHPEYSALALPNAPLAPALPAVHGVSHTLRSASLKEERRYVVYTPPGYASLPHGACGVLIAFDGEWYGNTLAPIVAHEVAARRLPPLLVVAVSGQGTRYQDLGCSRPFTDFLAEELLPAVWRAYPATTHAPKRTIVAGASFGGLCAAYCALTYPQTFGNVLSQSGSFWFTPDWQTRYTDAPPAEGFLPALVMRTRRLPIRFSLQVGTFEGATQLYPNRNVRDILRLKGYDVTYSEFHGGHDLDCWATGATDALHALTRDWPSKGK